MSQIKLAHPDLPEPTAVAVTASDGGGWRVEIAGRTLELHLHATGADSGIVRLGAEVYPYYAARRENRLQLWIAGRTHSFAIAPAGRRPSADHAAALADLAAPMPGTVRAIRVAAGDAFAAHDPLIILESMKMEMTLSAPAAGSVVEVCCAEGDLVEMGARLLKLEGEGR